MLTITKRFKFEASHFLPNHEGKCGRFHGHSYKLYVTVTGRIHNKGSNAGMIMDFSELKDIVNEYVINPFDHSDLNDFFNNPTAELIVDYIGKLLFTILKEKDIALVSVKLWETEDSYAEYKPEQNQSLKYVAKPVKSK